jgi:hypothetical protein
MNRETFILSDVHNIYFFFANRLKITLEIPEDCNDFMIKGVKLVEAKDWKTTCIWVIRNNDNKSWSVMAKMLLKKEYNVKDHAEVSIKRP